MLLLTQGQRYSYSAYAIGGDVNTGQVGPLFQPAFTILGRPITVVQLLVVSTSVALMLALTLLVSRTRSARRCARRLSTARRPT